MSRDWSYEPESLWEALSTATGDRTKSGLTRRLGEKATITTQVATDAFVKGRLSANKIARWTRAVFRPRTQQLGPARIIGIIDDDGHTTYLAINRDEPIETLIDEMVPRKWLAERPTEPLPEQAAMAYISTLEASRTEREALEAILRDLQEEPSARIDAVTQQLIGQPVSSPEEAVALLRSWRRGAAAEFAENGEFPPEPGEP